MYDRIVIAVDGSDQAQRAARHGLQLAQTFDATVTIISVVDQKALRLTKNKQEKARLRDRAETALADIETLATEISHSVTTKVLDGNPAVRISEFAKEQSADLIVVGRQGITGLRRRLLGGVTEQLLQQSSIPVLVVPDIDTTINHGAGYSRILLPTDGSKNADLAIPHGIEIAQRYDALLHVFYSVDLQAAGGVFTAGGLEKEFVDRLEAIGHDAVERVSTSIADSAPDLTVETAVQRTTSFEGAAAGIREYAETNQIDLIVMGSHGRSNLRRQLLGSIASTVLRTSDVPILIVERPS